MRDAPVRVGVMLDSLTVPFWASEIIEAILTNPNARLELVVLNGAVTVKQKRSWVERLRHNHFLYYRFSQYDDRRIAASIPGCEDRNLESRCQGVPVLTAFPIAKKFVQHFSAEDLQAIRSRHLDLLIRFGFRILKGDILRAARFGVWSYHHGDNDFFRGSPPGFWEVYEKRHESGVTLQVLTEELDGGWIIGKTTIRTDLNSPAKNAHNLRLAGIRLFKDALDRLVQGGSPDEFRQSLAPSKSYYPERGLYRLPTNLQMTRFLTANMAPAFLQSRLAAKAKTVQWSVGWTQNDLLDPTRPAKAAWFQPDASRFIADPFPLRHQGRVFIFVEDYHYRLKQGRISVFELDRELQATELKPVLEAPFHLSFPFLLQSGGRLFMVPDQSQSGQVGLYECAEFPAKWVKNKNLLEDQACVDTVLFFHENRWWLFTTKTEYGFGQNSLYLYYSDDLFGAWTPHPKNPIKNRVRGSRMAGNLFPRGGRIIRPAQNCAVKYGGSIVLFEVLNLSPTDYEERELQELLPSSSNAPWDWSLHTINHLDGLTILDGGRLLPSKQLWVG